MFDYSFIDLDNTLYDTVELEGDMVAIFKKYGVRRRDYDSTFYRSLCTVSPDQYDYSFKEQVQFLRELDYDLPDAIINELDALLIPGYLFTDAYDFVNFIKTISKKTILLTAGDKEFQEQKISGCGAGDWFDEVVIIPGGKEKYLQEHCNNNKILFINDNLRENISVSKNVSCAQVVIKFSAKHYHEEEVKKTNLPYFKNLLEIKNYVSEFI